MITTTQDVNKLFNEVLQEISQNIRNMMEELWLNWSHLGVDDSTKVVNITKLVQIEKELHRDVIFETRQKVKIMQAQVDKLKEETEELSKCLSVDITILDFKEDMMLIEYKRGIEEQIAGYREQVEQRKMKMDRLFEWQRDLTEKLGVTIQELKEVPLPSEEELDRLKEHLVILQAERDKRAEIFLNTQMEIKEIMDKLQMKPSNKFEQVVLSSLSVDFKVTDLNMDRLGKLRQDLQEKYEQTNNRVLELRERLTKLWDCLEEDQIYRESFLQSHPGCHAAAEAAIRDELKRCDQIKRQKIQVYIKSNDSSKIPSAAIIRLPSSTSPPTKDHVVINLWDCLEEDQIYRESFLQSHPGCHAAAEPAIRDELKRCDQIKRQKIQPSSDTSPATKDHVSTKLWDCLEEDQIYRESFLQSHPGCHAAAEAAIRDELKRCDQIRRLKIQVFIANVRTKIKLMWDSCMYGAAEREQFVHYYQDVFSEDTLTLHELYLDKITKFYEDHKEIFELVAMRKNLWSKMCELEGRATEPGRYHNRGGQLLKEEKERKAIASNLPKIEAQLRELVSQFEARTGHTFTVDGRPLLQLIQEEWDTRKTERANKLSARKQALTPKDAALFRSLATSPLGKRNRTAAGLAATQEKNRPPSKRQLITGSATKAVTTFTNNLSALKRSAISTVKRRVSGRLAARAMENSAVVKRKLDYGGDNNKRTPKATVNGSILKHKRTSHGKRRSGGRKSLSARSNTSGSQDDTRRKDPLMETTMLTTYTDFKDGINEKQISRSSMATAKPFEIPTINVCQTIDERNTPLKKTPKTPVPLTPKIGKENIQHNHLPMTPKNNLMYTPTRLTRSALKLNNDGFATPRAPLSATKVNMQRQNTMSNIQVKTNTPNNLSRSKTHTHLVRVKNLPPLI
ncbi:unnamed protein product [Plutella xylostella]|uniref:(diamondback moth) hypothetical protein n=1 Tax=Plutella xylostella TaxID=51655 RepID=A0A8S4G5R1_PLUXY|nr:unnamed protein product [Plutella xylostella]